MRKLFTGIAIAGTTTALFVILFLFAFMINDTQPEDCTVVSTKVVKVLEGSSYDIVFRNAHNDGFYINRGLEQGLNLDSLRNNVLNKTVTLHLAKLPIGTSSHISQLEIDGEILFTEFD